MYIVYCVMSASLYMYTVIIWYDIIWYDFIIWFDVNLYDVNILDTGSIMMSFFSKFHPMLVSVRRCQY